MMTQQTEHTSLSSGQDMRKKKKGLISIIIIFCVFVFMFFSAVRFTTTNTNNVEGTSKTDTDTDTDITLMDISQVGGIPMCCPHGCTYYMFGCDFLGNPPKCEKEFTNTCNRDLCCKQ